MRLIIFCTKKKIKKFTLIQWYFREEQSNYIIPIGSTGYAAEKVALDIKNNITSYPYLENYIDNLCVESDPNAIAKLVLHIITDIRNNVVNQQN